MDEQTIKRIATVVTEVAALKASGVIDDLENDANELVTKLKAKLPAKKADGTPWTDEDLHALATEATGHFDAAIERSKIAGE